MNFNILRYFEDTHKQPSEKLVKFEFRNKEKEGWPGDVKIVFDSDRKIFVDRKIRMALKQFFQLNRCLFCIDKLNNEADISFGDCYIKDKEDVFGKSDIIIRTLKGKALIEKYADLFCMEKDSIDRVMKAQAVKAKEKNYVYLSALPKELKYDSLGSIPKLSLENRWNFYKAQKYIHWGEAYNKQRIDYNLLVKRVSRKVKFTAKLFFKKTYLLVTIVLFFLHTFFGLFRIKKADLSRRSKKNVLIFGGELFNKGAQAMTFTVVDQIRRKFPDKDIYLFSKRDYDRPKKEKEQYRFFFLPKSSDIELGLLGNPVYGLLAQKRFGKKTFQTIESVFKEAAFAIDISGFALSSQWGFFKSCFYLFRIASCRKRSIPFYIFPQSIGPFDYPVVLKATLLPLVKYYLSYASRIFVREGSGIQALAPFKLSNISTGLDIVLQNEEYNLSNIFVSPFIGKNFAIPHGAIAIIPNERVSERISEEVFQEIYFSVISQLLKAGKRVYLLRHSYEDLKLCQQIKQRFFDNDNVCVITEDLNVIDANQLIKQFDFIIASRYHSIVHAYKNAVPAIVIGWADKYLELMKNFDQEQYLHDSRGKINSESLEKNISIMLVKRDEESSKINLIKKTIIKQNVFEVL
jgi:colanic acid/amylovoran biosynthesis protein